MTQYLVDVSRHQVERPDPLDLAQAKAAGFTIANVQLDRGKQQDVLPAWAPEYVAEARRLGMGVSTYRWLDARIPGAESARRAYDRIVAVGGPDGMAHIVDCEADASEQHLRDYITTMTQLLGRPIGLYSGDWWLQPRGWYVAGLTPYLMAAPNAGYVGTYPGDTSPHWQAGYGGFPYLSVMQYAVAPLPGTGNCSLSAIRDPQVWAALTGGAAMGGYQDWINAGKPVSGVARPVKKIGDRLRGYGYTVYYIGDEAHLKASTPQDHTPFSATGWPVASPRWWIFADDIMPPPAGKGLPSLQQLGAQMLADAKAGHPGMRWLKYMNWEPERNNGGPCYQERFTPTYERRSSSDRGHIHQSCRSDMKDYTGADDYDPVARIRAGGGDPAPAPGGDDDVQTTFLIKMPGDLVGRVVTMGVGHLQIFDEADLGRWQNWMAANGLNDDVFPWPAEWMPQCGPNLAAQPVLAITPEVATAIAQQIIAAGSNSLGEDDLDAIRDLVVEGAKQAAREGSGGGSA